MIFLQGLVIHFTFNRHKSSERNLDLPFPHEVRADHSPLVILPNGSMKVVLLSSFDTRGGDMSF